MTHNPKSTSGFTLIEAMLMMAITAILLSMINFSVLRTQTQADLDTEITKLETDLKDQQLKSMVGVTISTTTPVSFGIYFATSSYTIFRGASYNPADTNNFSNIFPPTIQIIIDNFPGNSVVFSRVSGEVSGYTVGQDNITLQNSATNETRVVTINKYGAVTKP